MKHGIELSGCSKKIMNLNFPLTKLAQELLSELSSVGAVERLKEIPNLGGLTNKRASFSSKFDYIALQFFYHKLIKDSGCNLKYAYGSSVSGGEGIDEEITILDFLQILIISYNIGHFANTFSASRAALLLNQTNREFNNLFLRSVQDGKIIELAQKILNANDYYHLHILNSLIVLDSINQKLISVLCAKKILIAYLDDEAIWDPKLNYLIGLFRIVRDVAYMSLDLPEANVPLFMDTNEKAIKELFSQLLDQYNNQAPANNMLSSLNKLLADSLYHSENKALLQNKKTKRIVNNVQKLDYFNMNYLEDFLLSPASEFNRRTYERQNCVCNEVLKITLSENENEIFWEIFQQLNKTSHVQCAYYDRHDGNKSILIGINKSCTEKTKVAFRVLRIMVNNLRNLIPQKAEDNRYLIISRFFLHYFFLEKDLEIQPSVHQEIAVICVRGKSKKLLCLEDLLSDNYGKPDSRYEVEFLKSFLANDLISDTSILFPASILVFEDAIRKKTLCEFDGIIIHPNRKNEQIVFLEAKNRRKNKSLARTELIKKLKKCEIEFEEDSVIGEGRNAYFIASV